MPPCRARPARERHSSLHLHRQGPETAARSDETAAPLALAGSGRNGVIVATVTLRANLLPYWKCQDSGAFASGSGAVPISIAFG